MMRDAETETGLASDAFPAELLVWLSPGFPVGGFAYSHGLETAVASGRVTDRESLLAWLRSLLVRGGLRNDLIIQSLLLRAQDANAVGDLIGLSLALQPSAERRAEATVQGSAFREACVAGWCDGHSPGFGKVGFEPITYAVAVAIAARERGLPLEPLLQAYALAFQSNLVSAAIRLGVIGQFDGQRVLARLMQDVRRVCAEALNAEIHDIGSATFAADLASMQHETQTVRLFRS